MYKVFKNGIEAGTCQNPKFVKRSRCNCFIPATKADASHIVWDGEVFPLSNSGEGTDGEAVYLHEVAAEDVFAQRKDLRLAVAQIDYLSMMSGIDIPSGGGDGG